MAGEAEVGVGGNNPTGNNPNTATPPVAGTPTGTPEAAPSTAPLLEPLTPQAALARLKARRELASTPQQEQGAPATPASPEKSVAQEAPKTEQVIEDDLDGLLGSAAPEATEPEVGVQTGGNEDDPFVFEIDGKQIPRSEARSGYLRHQDFTAKTQGLTEVRKTFETEISAASEERKRYGTLLGEQLNVLKASEPARPDPALKATDPMGYSEQLVEYLSHQDQVRAREAQIHQLVNEQREADRKLFEVRKAEEQAKMLEVVPSLKTAKSPEQRGKLLMRFKQTALDAGFGENELSRMIDHRVIRVLEWATIGRAVQNGTIKGRQTQKETRTATNGSTPPVLPSQSLRATGGGGPPEIKTKGAREVQQAETTFDKARDLRAGVALLRARRAARQQAGE